jgi:hypothetical protein
MNKPSIDLRREYDFWKICSFKQAQSLAEQAMKDHPGHTFLPCDFGPAWSPRFGICQPPIVGEDASYGFNGDYYPAGKVEKVGKDYKIITVGGIKYYRRKLTSSWIRQGGTWSLVRGIHDERNPEF